jgi:hypothetical protein
VTEPRSQPDIPSVDFDRDTIVDSLVNDLAAEGIDCDEYIPDLPDGSVDPIFAIDAIGQIQDDVIEALSTAWPSCPGHSHPMSLEFTETWLAWCCPATGRQIAEYGGLAYIRD